MTSFLQKVEAKAPAKPYADLKVLNEGERLVKKLKPLFGSCNLDRDTAIYRWNLDEPRKVTIKKVEEGAKALGMKKLKIANNLVYAVNSKKHNVMWVLRYDLADTVAFHPVDR